MQTNNLGLVPCWSARYAETEKEQALYCHLEKVAIPVVVTCACATVALLAASVRSWLFKSKADPIFPKENAKKDSVLTLVGKVIKNLEKATGALIGILAIAAVVNVLFTATSLFLGAVHIGGILALGHGFSVFNNYLLGGLAETCITTHL